jgi:hypothetical protein
MCSAPLLSLVSVLERSAAVVDDVLADADPECAVLIEPEHLTEFSGTFAYLLTWKFLLLLISSSSAQVVICGVECRHDNSITA